MSSSGKFDLSSGSPDRPLYTAGQRGSYITGSMDRSASFRENMENPILSSLPSMSRSTSTVTQGDVTNFLQCLRFDPKSMAAEYKFNRHGDFKRLASAALGGPDDSPSGSFKSKVPSSSPEDLKRLRAGLRESTIKARERVKIFSESLSVVNKCFPGIPLRKRSRPDTLSGDRASGLLADRAVMGPGVSKMGTQNHVPMNAFDFEQQKVEERVKNTVPNKRTRTSMVDQRTDVRPNTPARSTASVDRDKEVLRFPNSNALQGEDRALPIVADGWEKAKMKKKRSGIKADAASSPSSVSMKPIDGYRDPKQGIHPRHLPDARSRLNDTHGFRLGAANGVVGAGKADGTSQQASMGGRSSIPRPEQESVSLLHDKRDRSNSSEKERTNIRAVNKASVREEFISGSPSSTKLHAAARGPRSGLGVAPKLSPVVQRATASNDWELPHGASKNPGAVGSTNRKRTLSTRSSSPPVAQWADRRPLKMSRTARRTNLVPIVSSNDEIPALDSSDVTGSESGPGFARRFPANSPRQSKSKGDHLPSSTLSESEESGAAEFRSRDKGKKSDEVEDKAGQVQKMSTLVLPTRKNKLVNGEDIVDGVRRQGRTGRGFASARSVAPLTVEKLGNVGTTKQLRTARLCFDKSESRSGRPPTRKLSDRKAYTRQKHTPVNVSTDFLDNGHEELLAAESAVINPSRALSSPFWRQVEPLFGFVSDMDISYLKQQGSIQSTVSTTNPVSLEVPNGPRVVEPPKDGTENRNTEINLEPSTPGTASPGDVPLCQRLLAALISEENDEPTCSGNDDLKFNVYGSTFELETVESKVFNHHSLQNLGLGGNGTFSGYGINSTLGSCNELVHSLSDKHIMSMPDSEIATGSVHSYNGLLSEPVMTSSATRSQYHYGFMSMNERLLLEIQSIGLYPELVPDLAQTGDEDISGDISELEKKHHEQVYRKKSLLDKLLKTANEARELQEKEFEQHSLDKLTGMAYQKYMSCWRPNAPGGKSAGSKLAKQAALAFVKRTLERCHEFETTGKSCFTEPLYREMFLSGSSHFSDEQVVAITDGESGQVYGNSMERVSGTQLSPSLNNHDMYLSNALVSVNHSSEQTIGKDEIWSSRVKKRELYLDDVVAGTSAGTPSGIGTTILNGAKGKRSERDREGKGNGREVLSRNGAFKVGRPASSNAKGERKAKTKLKQKTTQLSASVNGALSKNSDQHKPTFSSVPKSVEIKISNLKENDKSLENSEEPLDFSNLQLPEMDVLGGDDFGEQGQDIGSWLNIDDDVLQDDDFMGLEIPMDDLSDLNMMV